MNTNHHLAECHLFRIFDKNILFNVDTMLFYEVTPLVCDLISLLRNPNHPDPVKSLKRQYHKADILNALAYLEQEGFVGNGRRAVPLTKRWGIRHLELMVTHGCNMACRYCYGSMGREEWKDCPYLYGAHSSEMSLETAKKGVDYLFKASGNRKDLSVIFFGGEPLLAFRLIEQMTPYIREKEKATGKNVSLSLSTNGFLLTQRIVDFLVKNRIGCQISIDGPPEIQNHNRPMPTGKGSYERILPGIKRLIAARPGRVPARVTVAHRHVDLPAAVEHLLK